MSIFNLILIAKRFVLVGFQVSVSPTLQHQETKFHLVHEFINLLIVPLETPPARIKNLFDFIQVKEFLCLM